jgi:PLP dependent protein
MLKKAMENLFKVQNEIARLGKAQLIAVSKTIAQERIREALQAGQRAFGENYVQEAGEKWPRLREEFQDVEVHLIGALQSNKALEAVKLFECIHTLDRESLAKALANAIQKQGKAPKLLVQVNIGEEPQKGGVMPREADKFIQECQKIYGLTISGLMCIPPADIPPAPYFGLLNVMAKRNGVQELSMGMSSDYEAAIKLGATCVRVGSAIFGVRT